MSEEFTIKLEGLTETLAAMAAYGAKTVEALDAALYKEGEREMTLSKHLVPVDTGSLRSTGHVDEPVRDGDTVYVGLGYGGVAGNGTEVGYAAAVHERLDLHHKVGQAKYLEQPMKEEYSSGRTEEVIAAEMKARLSL
jgi:hypothetical protein